MLKKSTANPNPPNLKEISPRGKGIPSNPPQAAAKTGGSKAAVIQTEIKPAGRNSSSSTFTAPRKGDSGDPMHCGYTKLK